MTDKPATEARDDAAQAKPGLDKPTQDFLGQKLRAAYNEVAEKPAFLGDPTLPPEIEDQLLELETRIRAHEKGTEAVREALGIPEPEPAVHKPSR
jgi:hypothetical protein